MKNLKDCCTCLVATGYATVEMSPSMMQSYSRLLQEYWGVEIDTKARYSFAQDTDGFLPYGLEYAKDKGKPDLCERFCYWHAHVEKRQADPFATSSFIQAAVAYEAEVSALAQRVLDGVADEFANAPLPSIRQSSYLQLCVYGAGVQVVENRQFAQDPHEDGHLLSFIRPNRDGLVLLRGRAQIPVRLLANELAVLSGSLLTELSESAIPAAYHAVLASEETMPRCSLIYFANPQQHQDYVGFWRRRPVDLHAAMVRAHVGFGNEPIRAAASPMPMQVD